MVLFFFFAFFCIYAFFYSFYIIYKKNWRWLAHALHSAAARTWKNCISSLKMQWSGIHSASKWDETSYKEEKETIMNNELWTANRLRRNNNWPSSLNYMEISLKLIFNFLVATFNKEQSNSLLHRNIALLNRPSSSWLIEGYKNNENKHKRKNDLEPDWPSGNYERERSLQQITSHDLNEEQRQKTCYK